MRTIVLLLVSVFYFMNGYAQSSESELIRLKVSPISVHPTNKSYQSYLFELNVEEVIKGDYQANVVVFESHAVFFGDALLQIFNCSVENNGAVTNCSGSAIIDVVIRKVPDFTHVVLISVEPDKR